MVDEVKAWAFINGCKDKKSSMEFCKENPENPVCLWLMRLYADNGHFMFVKDKKYEGDASALRKWIVELFEGWDWTGPVIYKIVTGTTRSTHAQINDMNKLIEIVEKYDIIASKNKDFDSHNYNVMNEKMRALLATNTVDATVLRDQIEKGEEVVFRVRMYTLCNESCSHYLVWSALESFTINYEPSFFFYNYVYFNMGLNFFLIIFLFYLIYSFNFNILKAINISFYSNYILNFFFDIFKTLIKSIRLERYFIFIISIFVYILFQNLGGFSLFEVSLNTYAVVTLFLSFITFFNYCINFLINYNEITYKKFVQKKLRLILIFVLFIIELVSYFVRPFSLGVRLFANILSGHILMHIFFNAFLFAYKMFFWISILLLLFCIFILIMELFVSFVQSYIFFILCVIYLKDVYELH